MGGYNLLTQNSFHLVFKSPTHFIFWYKKPGRDRIGLIPGLKKKVSVKNNCTSHLSTVLMYSSKNTVNDVSLRYLSLAFESGPQVGVPVSLYIEGSFHSANTRCLLMGVPVPLIPVHFVQDKAPLYHVLIGCCCLSGHFSRPVQYGWEDSSDMPATHSNFGDSQKQFKLDRKTISCSNYS